MKDTTNYTLIEESDAQHLQNLQDSLDRSPWLDEVEERCELEDALQNTCKVSPEVAAQCAEEMAQAKKRRWRLK